MRYDHYGIGDFVRDAFFQRWTLAPDSETDIFWNQWLQEHPDKQFVVKEAKRIIHLLGFSTNPEINQRLLATWESLDIEGAQDHTADVRGVNIHYAPVLRAAAAVAILLVSGFVIWYIQQSNITIRTEFSEIRSITLPDGSAVDLNGNSSIEYANNWDKEGRREVWLKGEAFFSVSHNAEKPFVVHTADGIDVNVLGTTFNVMTRRNTTRVSLNTGKIAVHLGKKFLKHDKSKSDDDFIMLPGEVAEFDVKTRSVTKHVAPVEQYAAWKDKKLIFDNTAMQDVAVMLQDAHGIQVRLDEPLRMRKITGEFRSDDLDILIAFIARALDARVRRDVNEIYFESKTK